MEVKGVYSLNQSHESPQPVLRTGPERIRLAEVIAMSEKYETHVKSILAECPDADPDEIAAAFEKYEKEFFIPPQDLSLIHI